MTSAADMSHRSRPATQMFDAPADGYRSRLVALLQDQSIRFAQREAALSMLTSSSPSGTTALDRALAALDLYIAREAIEEVEAALLRSASGPSTASHATDRRRGRAQSDGVVLRGVASRRTDLPLTSGRDAPSPDRRDP
jgi:hypothetical protein